MQSRNLIILAIALFIGLIAVIVANGWFSGVAQRQERIAREQALARIVVATQPMEFGDRLTEQTVRLQNWPAQSVPTGAFTSIADALKDNRVALRPIVPGEPVLASKVSGTDGRATLAALLPEGMRAFSIPVSAVNGVAGFVLPGTMVDILLTRKIAGDGAGSEDLRSDVILQNVQVLAVDQLASDKEGKPKVSRTATVAVPLFEAQRLAIAQRVGTLSLALRRVEDSDAAGVRQAASTVTNRQLGGPRLYIASRSKGTTSAAASSQAPSGDAFFNPPAYRGPVMSVIRGVEKTDYPVGHLGGW